jgi:hypothetical protein
VYVAFPDRHDPSINHHPDLPMLYTMSMATAATTAGSIGAPATQLKSLAGRLVTVTTVQREVTGTVLSCTRRSVWLVCDDVDVVVTLADITSLFEHSQPAAA